MDIDQYNSSATTARQLLHQHVDTY